jgi:hypothetical protein
MLLLGMIVLFNADCAKLRNRALIEMQSTIYKRLLKKYV